MSFLRLFSTGVQLQTGSQKKKFRLRLNASSCPNSERNLLVVKDFSSRINTCVFFVIGVIRLGSKYLAIVR